MRLEAKKYLYDIKQAADLLVEFTAGEDFSDYEREAVVRAAVERKLEIVGALSKLAKLDPSTALKFTEYARLGYCGE